MKKIFKVFLIIALSLITLLLLLAATESYFRRLEGKAQVIPNLPLKFVPYLMYTSGLAGKPGDVWRDQFTNTNRPTSLKGNNMGFAADFDFTFVPDADYLKKYGKKENERIVLFTGGSVAHGVGASSNQQTISARMEKYLNDSQNKYHYRVLNLGMGSWIAYQEFIALDLIGRQFDPDWIVVMDGVNDAASFGSSIAGVGNPMMWPLMKYTIEGQTLHPPFEEYLIRNFSTYRALSGKSPSSQKDSDLKLNPSHPDPRFRICVETVWDDIQKQILFYVRTQEAILQHFEKARFILSTQSLAEGCGPDYHAYYTASDETAKKAALTNLLATLDTINTTNQGVKLTTPVTQASFNYFLPKSALALEQLISNCQKSKKRDAQYCNTELALPASFDERKPYFLDYCHMTDQGQDCLGRFYADQILKRDAPGTEIQQAKEPVAPSPVPDKTPRQEEKPILRMEGGKTSILLPGNVEIAFCKIPAGEFAMGSPADEKGRNENEGPQHTVKIPKPFWVSKFEVTQAQWKAVMGSNPSNFQGDNLPVEKVFWNDCQEFVKKLNSLRLGTYRLPAEAEWEYACRGKTDTRYYWSKDDDLSNIGNYAWYSANGEKQTHEVGKKLPNGFGLYDMSGNVWEWCQDNYGAYPDGKQNGAAGSANGTKYIIRGGAFDNGPAGCRSAVRVEQGAEIRGSVIGFRLVMEDPSASS